MKYIFRSILLLALAAPAFAQDDCPPGHVRHPAITALDDASMLAAYTASYRAIVGHDPSMRPGDGAGDGWYWIHASNHYGVYGDDQCHAGWSGYWESWLQTGHGDLKLVQAPARFQPTSAPPVNPPVVPPPAPLPVVQTCDLTAALSSLERIEHKVDATNQNVTDGRAENKTFFTAVANNWKGILKWATTIGLSGVIGAKVAH
jgi:hypothetical protein